MANKFTNQANTAPVVSAMKNKPVKVPHSFFDLSAPIIFDAPLGAIIPFDLLETLPDSDYEISYDIMALTKNPLTRRLLSGMTVYIHTYAIDSKDLWEGFPTFVTRGRSGKITRKVPQTVNAHDKTASQYATFGSHQFSPSSYLGVPCNHRTTTSVASNELLYNTVVASGVIGGKKATFNALPLVMYQQICIHNYMPSNLLQDNKHFFPDDEKHLCLSPTAGQDGKPVYSLSYDDDVAEAELTPAQLQDVSLAFSDTPVILDSLRVRQFQGDFANTGLPWPELIRGDIPSISLAEDLELQNGQVVIPKGQPMISSIQRQVRITGDSPAVSAPLVYRLSSGTVSAGGLGTGDVLLANDSGQAVTFNDKKVLQIGSTAPTAPLSLGYDFTGTATGTVSVQSTVTMSQLNALKVLTLMRQRAALTDGSYNELIRAQYNTSPDLHVGKPLYIGGTKQPLVFSEVVQTSESSTSSPLGRTGSRAVSAGNGYIGKYHAKDFGYIMSVLTILPDVYYAQGMHKLWSRVNHDDYHFPLMENLEPEPVLNKELYYSGNSSVDDDVFSYQERNYEYKSRLPRLAGNMQFNAAVDEEDSAYAMRRHFDVVPTLSYGFTGMFPSNMDYSVFSNTVDAPFIFSIQSRVRATLPLSYNTVPNEE